MTSPLLNLSAKIYEYYDKYLTEKQLIDFEIMIQWATKTLEADVNGEKDQKGLTLYTDKTKTNKVAILPIGSDIEVLLHEKPDWYLVRSSFGLVGWVFVPFGLHETKIGVRFAGD